MSGEKCECLVNAGMRAIRISLIGAMRAVCDHACLNCAECHIAPPCLDVRL
jgi:hypothetical protein